MMNLISSQFDIPTYPYTGEDSSAASSDGESDYETELAAWSAASALSAKPNAAQPNNKLSGDTVAVTYAAPTYPFQDQDIEYDDTIYKQALFSQLDYQFMVSRNIFTEAKQVIASYDQQIARFDQALAETADQLLQAAGITDTLLFNELRLISPEWANSAYVLHLRDHLRKVVIRLIAKRQLGSEHTANILRTHIANLVPPLAFRPNINEKYTERLIELLVQDNNDAKAYTNAVYEYLQIHEGQAITSPLNQYFVEAVNGWISPENLSLTELISIGQERAKYFIKKRGWFIPPMREDLVKVLAAKYHVSVETFVGLDLDENDFATGSEQWRSKFFKHDENEQPADAGHVIARLIALQSAPLALNVENGKDALREQLLAHLREIENSPFDNSKGPAIDADILALADAASAKNGTADDEDRLLLARVRSAYPNWMPNMLPHPSASEQIASLMANVICGDTAGIEPSVAEAVQKYLQLMQEGKEVVLFERLMTDGIELDQFAAAMSPLELMTARAQKGFEDGNTIWLVQCDAMYEMLLTGLFGPQALSRIALTNQIRHNTKAENDPKLEDCKKDQCGTFILDIDKAMKYLLQQGTPAGIELYNRLSPVLQKRFEQYILVEA